MPRPCTYYVSLIRRSTQHNLSNPRLPLLSATKHQLTNIIMSTVHALIICPKKKMVRQLFIHECQISCLFRTKRVMLGVGRQLIRQICYKSPENRVESLISRIFYSIDEHEEDYETSTLFFCRSDFRLNQPSMAILPLSRC